MTSLLPDRLARQLARQLAGRCCYGACAEPAQDGDYCAPHDAHERGRDAGKKRRRRQRLADQGLCIIAGCDRKVTKRRRPDGKIQQRRCSRCQKEMRAVARARRSVPDDSRSVPGEGADLSSAAPTRGRMKQESGGDKWARTRFVGRDRKGGPTREDKDRDIVKDAEYAAAEIVKFIRAFELARGDEVQALPRVQREAALRLAVDHARYAASFLDDIVEQLGTR